MDEKRAVGIKQVGEKTRSNPDLVSILTREIATIAAKPRKTPRKRKDPTNERRGDKEGSIEYVDIRINSNHQGEGSNSTWI